MKAYGAWMAEAFTAYLTGKPVKVALYGDGFVLPSAGLEFRDALDNEIVGDGYVTGGVDAGALSVTFDDAADTLAISCAVVEFEEVDLPAVHAAVFYIDEGDPALDRVLAIDVVASPAPFVGELTYTPAPEGLLVLELA